jgi:allantoate deiminase
MARIAVDPALLDQRIIEFARFGAHGETGVWRPVYSAAWVAAMEQYAAWCADAGLDVRTDAVGNVWGRLAGADGGKAIISGSHIDSQLPGGRYDGTLGALGALVAIQTLKERFGTPKRTLEVVALCEEESSRFAAANFWGSRAITGRIGPDDPDNIRGYDGDTIAEVMRRVGLDPARILEAERDDIDTFIELHVEQGPILEQAGLPVAIVNAITGIRHYVVELSGTANHAGAFPMDLRRDPMAGAAEIISGVVNTAHRIGRPAVTTVGMVRVDPNLAAAVPEKVTFTIDARHPDPLARDALYAKHEGLMREVAAHRSLDLEWHQTLDHAPFTCDPATVRILEDAAREQGIPFMTMTSGAVHDAQQMATKCKAAMIFVRSKDGRSHTPEEFSSVADCTVGTEVLAAALYSLAY